MFKLSGQIERETEKAVLFSATVLYIGRGPDDSRASVWFPKSRIAQIVKAETEREHDAIVFEDSNEWLLSAKEREQANGQWVFVPQAVN